MKKFALPAFTGVVFLLIGLALGTALAFETTAQGWLLLAGSAVGILAGVGLAWLYEEVFNRTWRPPPTPEETEIRTANRLLARQLTQQAEQLHALQAQLTTAQAAEDAQKTAQHTLQTQFEVQAEALSTAQHHLDDTRQALAEQKDEAEGLHQLLGQREATVAALQNQLARLQTRLQNAELQTETLAQAQESLRQQQAQAEKLLNLAETKVAHLQAKLTQGQRERETLQATLSRYTSQLEQYQKDAKMLAHVIGQRKQAAAELQAQLATVQNSLTEKEAAIHRLTHLIGQRDQALTERKNHLTQAEHQLEALRRQVATAQAEVRAVIQKHPDDLRVIDGIGPGYQQKLRDIGIHTYQALAEAEAEQVKRMLKIQAWQNVNVQSWIDQAKDWADQK